MWSSGWRGFAADSGAGCLRECWNQIAGWPCWWVDGRTRRRNPLLLTGRLAGRPALLMSLAVVQGLPSLADPSWNAGLSDQAWLPAAGGARKAVVAAAPAAEARDCRQLGGWVANIAGRGQLADSFVCQRRMWYAHPVCINSKPACHFTHLAVLAGQVAAPPQPGEEGQQDEAAQHAGQDDDVIINHLLLLGVDWWGG